MKIRDKELYLSKFWRHLVNVKIVKIWHLNSHISYINKKRNIFFCKNKYHNAVNHVPNFQLPARSFTIFGSVFPSHLWSDFFWDTQYISISRPFILKRLPSSITNTVLTIFYQQYYTDHLLSPILCWPSSSTNTVLTIFYHQYCIDHLLWTILYWPVSTTKKDQFGAFRNAIRFSQRFLNVEELLASTRESRPVLLSSWRR